MLMILPGLNANKKYYVYMHLFVHALTLNISLLYLHGSSNTKKFYIHNLPGILISLKEREREVGGKEEERLCAFFNLNIQAI